MVRTDIGLSLGYIEKIERDKVLLQNHHNNNRAVETFYLQVIPSLTITLTYQY